MLLNNFLTKDNNATSSIVENFEDYMANQTSQSIQSRNIKTQSVIHENLLL